MNTKCDHAEFILEYAKHCNHCGHDKPWKDVEISSDDTCWKTCAEHQKFVTGVNYRFIKKTFLLGGFEIPMSFRVAPGLGTDYFYPDISEAEEPYYKQWTNCDTDRELLKADLCFKTKEDCISYANAILVLTAQALSCTSYE